MQGEKAKRKRIVSCSFGKQENIFLLLPNTKAATAAEEEGK